MIHTFLVLEKSVPKEVLQLDIILRVSDSIDVDVYALIRATWQNRTIH
jgi:hypothetical protein